MIDLGTLKVLNNLAARDNTANAVVVAAEWASRAYFRETRDERALNRRAVLLARHIQVSGLTADALPTPFEVAKELIRAWDIQGREVRS